MPFAPPFLGVFPLQGFLLLLNFPFRLLLTGKIDLSNIGYQLRVVVLLTILFFLALGLQRLFYHELLVIVFHGVHCRVIKSLEARKDQIRLLWLGVDKRQNLLLLSVLLLEGPGEIAGGTLGVIERPLPRILMNTEAARLLAIRTHHLEVNLVKGSIDLSVVLFLS